MIRYIVFGSVILEGQSSEILCNKFWPMLGTAIMPNFIKNGWGDGVEEGDLIQIHKEVGRRHGGGPQDGSKPQLGVHHP